MNYDHLSAAATLPIAFILMMLNLLIGYSHYHAGKRWCAWVALAGCVCAVVVMLFCLQQLLS